MIWTEIHQGEWVGREGGVRVKLIRRLGGVDVFRQMPGQPSMVLVHSVMMDMDECKKWCDRRYK